jgi:OFA family oxalate/formate antiporter-like MFS transporter
MDSNKTRFPRTRWFLLGAAFCVMMVISIYQYSWFLFADHIQRELGWNMASLGLIYTIFHYTSTMVLPFSGFIADTCGPTRVALGASLLVSAGFVLCALLPEQWTFRIFYGLGGVGGGVLYGLSTATAIKWFPDRRGFASGLVVFGFGAGTALFNLGIEWLLEHEGLGGTFLWLGVGMLATLIPLSLLYRFPELNPRTIDSQPAPVPPPRSMGPLEMLRTPQWYGVYFSFSLTVSVVLLFGAQMKTMARDYGLPDTHFQALLVLFPLANGLSRVLAGAVSDKLGRERTMALFYLLLGASVIALLGLGRTPSLFVSTVLLASLLGGAPFALYPATIGDYYGPRYATANYGLTYTAKAWAGLISGWLSGYLVTVSGSYQVPLTVVAAGSFLAAILSSPWILKPPASGVPPSSPREPEAR